MAKRTSASAALDAAFAALADPTRRAIVARLADSQGGERTAGELAAPLPMSLPAVSRHLRVLEGAGLVARRREGRTHLLRLVPDALDPAGQWIARQRAFWTSRLDSLERYLAANKHGPDPKKPTRRR